MSYEAQLERRVDALEQERQNTRSTHDIEDEETIEEGGSIELPI
jgi:hypothetical protein